MPEDTKNTGAIGAVGGAVVGYLATRSAVGAAVGGAIGYAASSIIPIPGVFGGTTKEAVASAESGQTYANPADETPRPDSPIGSQTQGSGTSQTQEAATPPVPNGGGDRQYPLYKATTKEAPPPTFTTAPKPTFGGEVQSSKALGGDVPQCYELPGTLACSGRIGRGPRELVSLEETRRYAARFFHGTLAFANEAPANSLRRERFLSAHRMYESGYRTQSLSEAKAILFKADAEAAQALNTSRTLVAQSETMAPSAPSYFGPTQPAML